MILYQNEEKLSQENRHFIYFLQLVMRRKAVGNLIKSKEI